MIDASQSFSASQEHAEKILNWIRDIIKPLQLKKTISYHIVLCVEEAVINIINYAYNKKSGTVHISLKGTEKKVIIIIKDQGIPFNPISGFSRMDITSTLENRPIGGLGLYFIKELMNSSEYQRIDNSNVLTLVKKI